MKQSPRNTVLSPPSRSDVPLCKRHKERSAQGVSRTLYRTPHDFFVQIEKRKEYLNVTRLFIANFVCFDSRGLKSIIPLVDLCGV